MSGEIWLQPVHDPTIRRRANKWDRDYLAFVVLQGERNKAVVNDELLSDGSSVLLTVTKKAWEEMKVLG